MPLTGMVMEPMELENANTDPASPMTSGGPGGGVVQNHMVNNPTLDMEQYANSYAGMAKILRLMYIADHCPMLRADALQMVIQHITEKTHNVSMYQTAISKFINAVENGNPQNHPAVPNNSGGGNRGGGNHHAGNDNNQHTGNNNNQRSQSSGSNGPDIIPSDVTNHRSWGVNHDIQWMEQTSKRAALKLEKLDSDLKHYKANSIKESIRRGQDDLGEHYLDMGDLNNALKCFSRARDYCTSGKHVVTMCFNVIKVSIYLQNWSLVLSYVNRAENTAELSSNTVNTTQQSSSKESSASRDKHVAKLKVAAGLSELANGKYKAAARNFIQINFASLDYSEVISPQNVAQYGALCALASFDRKELKTSVLSNPEFKLFLELEPWLLEIIRRFKESEYGECLSRLEQERDNLLLDMYLAPHIPHLYAMIRNRGIVQYFSPYITADMHSMATAFNTTVGQLEEELMQLILDGSMAARIDSHNKILHAKDVDVRSSAFQATLSVGSDMQTRAHALILRAAMQRAKVCVRQPPKEHQQQQQPQHHQSAQTSSGATASVGGPSSSAHIPPPVAAAANNAMEPSVSPSNSPHSSPQQ